MHLIIFILFGKQYYYYLHFIFVILYSYNIKCPNNALIVNLESAGSLESAGGLGSAGSLGEAVAVSMGTKKLYTNSAPIPILR